jgi:alpha-beta hydrolase superfamily lysophospholipase
MAEGDLTPREGEVSALGPKGFLRIAYMDWGPPDAAQVVLCVHGLTRNSRDFDFLARRLAARGLRVLVPDLRDAARATGPLALRLRDHRFISRPPPR